MTVDQAMTALLTACGGFAAGKGLLVLRLQAPPKALLRTNVRGLPVPAVMGGPIAIAGLSASAVLAFAGALGWDPGRLGRMGAAVAVVVLVMAWAGSWDDRRGDERPRGFKGHLGAARSARLTGGMVKLLAGGVAGILAGVLIAEGIVVVQVALLVALTANLVNLFDRAPGRAGKAVLAVAAPLAVFGEPIWVLASAGILGALVGTLGYDLSERAMLGDAGANPLGAVLGLGLAATLGETGRWIAAGVVLALNLASEKWSFAAIIEATPPLRAVDRLGRRDRGESTDA